MICTKPFWNHLNLMIFDLKMGPQTAKDPKGVFREWDVYAVLNYWKVYWSAGVSSPAVACGPDLPQADLWGGKLYVIKAASGPSAQGQKYGRTGADEQTDRQTDGQTDRKTDRQLRCVCIHFVCVALYFLCDTDKQKDRLFYLSL